MLNIKLKSSYHTAVSRFKKKISTSSCFRSKKVQKPQGLFYVKHKPNGPHQILGISALLFLYRRFSFPFVLGHVGSVSGMRDET